MDSRTAETVSAESVSQAGAGGLLSAVGLVELALGLGSGWFHWAGAATVVVIGAVLLVRGIAAIVSMLHPSSERQAFAGAARSSASSAV